MPGRRRVSWHFCVREPMSTFAQNEKEAARKPETILVLPPDAFADDWRDRPTTEVAVGLRRLSERDEKVAKEQGRKIVFRDHVRDGEIVDKDLAWESYNDELIRYLMARAMCDVNDVSKPFFEYAEDVIHAALTTEGLKLVWDTWWMMKLTGPAAPVADDAALRRLARIIANPEEHMAKLGDGEKAARKLLAAALAGFGDLEVSDEDDDLEDEGAYVVSVLNDSQAPAP